MKNHEEYQWIVSVYLSKIRTGNLQNLNQKSYLLNQFAQWEIRINYVEAIYKYK